MAYRTVHERFWRDPKVLSLTPKNKLLFLYFITSADAHYSGVYYCPFEMIKLETNLTDKDIGDGIDTLCKGYMVEYDKGTSEVFVLNMAKFQVVSKQQVKGVANHFTNAVQSKELIRSFLDRYDTLSVPYEYPIDRVSKEEEFLKSQQSPKKTKPEKHRYGDSKKVLLTDDEKEKLDAMFGEKSSAERIQNLENYLVQSGKRYASHYQTILNWHNRDVKGNKCHADRNYVPPANKTLF